jgi:glucans biosynthesis protein C
VRKHLNFSNGFLKYTTQAVYPFYILHQTIIVISGYYVVQWPLHWVIKLLLLVVICFAGVGLLYHFIIRNFMLTRILYGLKWKK